jgi:hypothetical protein
MLVSSISPPLLSNETRKVISFFLYFLRLALCPKMRSTLERVMWATEKNVNPATVGWSIL